MASHLPEIFDMIMPPSFRSPVSNSPPELAELIGVYGRNFVRLMAARGELDELLVDRLMSEGGIDLRTLSRRRRRYVVRMEPGFEFRATGTLRALRRYSSTPAEVPLLDDSSFAMNFRWLGGELGLSDAERAVLLFAVVADCSGVLSSLVHCLQVERLEDLIASVAPMVALPREVVRVALSPTGVLRRSSLLSLEHPATPTGVLSVDSRLTATLLEPALDREKALSRFVRKEGAASLGLEDYGALAASLATTARLLQAAKARGEKGINVLFYGPSGVGKTEAARLVAHLAGQAVFLAGDDLNGEGSLSARARLASLSLGNLLLASGSAVLLFDELEDIIESPLRMRGGDEGPLSKLWLNRLLESNEVPTIWTTNSLASIDPAMLRRFSLALEFPPLSERQRRATWEKVAGGQLPAPRLDALAREHELSPAEIASAVRTARLTGGDAIDAECLDVTLQGATRLRGRPARAAQRVGREYRLEAVHASRDLVALADRLSAWRPGLDAGLTLCLYGRSGTGKSEYVHFLARRMDRPLVVRNVSDLMSKWVGDTERNIASAFEAAQREGAVLLFDEADSFLADRRGAMHAWERTQVNEFLQQLEACRGFVAVTTNLYQGLDPAVLRRFMFKVEFLPLRPEQRLLLWDAHLAPCLPAPLAADGQRQVSSALRNLGDLVPGDFGVVARRVRVLGGQVEAAELLRELAEEVASRRHDGSRRIGFGEPVFGPRLATGEARAVTSEERD